MTRRPKTEPRVRPATSDDAEIIAKMIHELAVYERAPEQCHATPEAVRRHLFGPHPKAEALIAESGAVVSGFALFFHNFSTWECAPGLYLEDLFVRPAHRRGGVGSALLAELARIARERECRRFEWIVLDWNKPAIDFYLKIGAVPLSDWTVFRLEGEALDRLAGSAPANAEAVPTPEPEPEAKPTAAGVSARRASGEKPVVEVYTDGGASPNPGVGAWAAVLIADGREKEVVGGELGTTNNRMELGAAIGALETLRVPCRVVMHTDSQYLRNGITSWIAKWKRNGWRRGKTADAAPVKNVDLWKRLDELCSKHEIEWNWVRGHAGDVYNERADRLCAARIAEQIAASTNAQRKAALEAEEQRQEREARGAGARFFS